MRCGKSACGGGWLPGNAGWGGPRRGPIRDVGDGRLEADRAASPAASSAATRRTERPMKVAAFRGRRWAMLLTLVRGMPTLPQIDRVRWILLAEVRENTPAGLDGLRTACAGEVPVKQRRAHATAIAHALQATPTGVVSLNLQRRNSSVPKPNTTPSWR